MCLLSVRAIGAAAKNAYHQYDRASTKAGPVIGEGRNVKQIVIVAKVFAFLSLLFVPSILVVLGLGYLFGNTMSRLFGMLGIAVFAANLAYLLTGDRRARLARKLMSLGGKAA